MAYQLELSRIAFGENAYNVVDHVPNYFLCPVCLSLMKDVASTSCCLKTFCSKCIETVKSSKQPCPTCREEDYVISPCPAIDKFISDLMVCCLNERKGCNWKGHLCFEESHRLSENGCPFQIVACQNGCQSILMRSEVEEHLERECKLRLVTCSQCELQGTYLFVTSKEHKEECILISCPHKCGVNNIPRRLMGNHIKKCPERKIRCPLVDIGCTDVIKRKNLNDHLISAAVNHCRLASKAKNEISVLKSDLKKSQQMRASEAEISNEWITFLYSLATMDDNSSVVLFVDLCEASIRYPSLSPICKCEESLSKSSQSKYFCHKSNSFPVVPDGDLFHIRVWPHGVRDGFGNSLSIYLQYDWDHSCSGLTCSPFDIWDIEVTVLNQLGNHSHIGPVQRSGWDTLISHEKLLQRTSSVKYWHEHRVFFKIDVKFLG